jgi:hypothetical protein
MKLARDVERRLERLVDGISAALFGGKLHPLDLADRLVREADLAATAEPAGRTVPNHFALTLHPDDLPDVLDRTALRRELAAALTAAAAERGWRLEGPAAVELTDGATTVPRSPRFAGSFVPGQLPRWGRLVGESGSRTLELRHNREVIGRSVDADLQLASPEVSRRHALVWREEGNVWIEDLGSANGTAVNGLHISEGAVLTDGDLVTLGPIDLSYRTD